MNLTIEQAWKKLYKLAYGKGPHFRWSPYTYNNILKLLSKLLEQQLICGVTIEIAQDGQYEVDIWNEETAGDIAPFFSFSFDEAVFWKLVELGLLGSDTIEES